MNSQLQNCISINERANNFEELDKKVQFHPFTDAKANLEQGGFIIERGEGVYVYDIYGKKYLEGMAGLWSVAVGFNNQRLINAAVKQLNTLPFYHQFQHKAVLPSIELSEKLIEMSPVPMSKAFLANSGSEANDTAIKLVWYYQNAKGNTQKKKIISRKNAYHGITTVASSLTGIPTIHKGFDLPLKGFHHLTCPNFYREALEGETVEQFVDRLAQEFEDLILAEGPETIAAFIGEPVMGAGGVIVPPKNYWEKIQAICKRYDILVIADEVICGFGRTGHMFGSETFNIKPDILVVSKQLSSSYQPISALMINEEIFKHVAEQTAVYGAFAHGFTGGGHPVAAAVALENLKIIEEEGLVERACVAGERLFNNLKALEDHPLVGEIRGVGLIAGIELVDCKTTKAPFETAGKLGRYFCARAHEHGLIIRNIGDVIALCPPLIISEAEIDELVTNLQKALNDTYNWRQSLS
ncbi:aspartate aminotransferase family protein [Acinetobacter baumannii]|uniref:aspartate aminotransferase family protein n=1 Tax=Acinetobacter baumannii TaxID=470 RepID=UPI0009A8F119|nr:aspartate aminotransferase family protein [Acinetobacter baumannii]OTT91913.1 aspartate aminotransferase family protein [Acinetobacter baumannii]